jgi:subtilase family serine protease
MNVGTLIITIISALFFVVGHAEAVQLYTTCDDGLSIAFMDPTTATGTKIGSMGVFAMGLTIDNSDGSFYTIADSGLAQGDIGVPRPTQQLALLDPLTGIATRVGQPMWNWIEVYAAVPALEVGNDGFVYAGGVDGRFYRINKTTGETTLLGTQSIMMVMDYAFDSQGTLWAVAGTQNDLYTIDISTGNATFVKRISGVTTIGSGIMGIMFDKYDVMYGTNIAAYPDAHLYLIDIAAGAATDLGALNLDQPHGGDVYLPDECIQPPSGIISWWPGDDNADDIVGADNGTQINGAGFSKGKVRKAFSFDGIDDYVEITSGAFDFGNAPFSIDFWMYSNTNGNNTYILGKSLPDGGEGFDIRLDNNMIQVVGVNGWGFNITSDASATPNGWHHIALASTDTTVDLYIDGVLKGSSARQSITTTANPFRIGFTSNFGGTAFSGLIDEVDIFDRALTSSEINEIYNAGHSGKCISDCTDEDSDTYAAEGGICGPVDCDDNNLAINPGASDNNCNGFDENCSGTADEGFVSASTTCGVGICASTGQMSCENGTLVDTCAPGQPQIEGPVGDPTCGDGQDNDCDGLKDTADTNCQTQNNDLIVSVLSAPSTAGAGQTISVSDTTKNNGPGAAGASTTKFYLSANSTYDAGDTELGSRSVPSLSSGTTSAMSTSITIPADAANGTYYIIARADANTVINETNENNNTRGKSIKIVPDLVVSALTAPSTVSPGQIISVSDTTKNNGPSATGPSTTRFYLSLNSSYDSGDTELGSRSVPSLASGAVSTGSTSVIVPADAANGTYYIIARADADGIITEYSETNNTRSKSVKIGTDLIVSALSAPSGALKGSTIIVADTIRNIGTSAASASTTRLYLSTNTTYDAGDTELAGRSVPSIAVGATNSGSTSVNIPSDITIGTYYIIARADADGVVSEINETNNLKNKSIVIGPGPDLIISGISAPASVSPGSAIDIADTTKNNGLETAGASTTRFYLSTNTTYDMGDLELASRPIPSLTPGTVSTGTTAVIIPSGITAGTYYIIARADADGVVTETIETNNYKNKAISINP